MGSSQQHFCFLVRVESPKRRGLLESWPWAPAGWVPSPPEIPTCDCRGALLWLPFLHLRTGHGGAGLTRSLARKRILQGMKCYIILYIHI